jgi:hypothetical protein
VRIENCPKTPALPFKPLLALPLLTLLSTILLSASTFAQPQISSDSDDQTMIIEDAPDMNVIAFGKTVIIRKRAKEVFAWGGDIIVEGRVEGDAATLGGSVIQKEGGYIGGAVIVIGGKYRPESNTPLRTEGKETVMIGAFEEEFREMGQNPSSIFAPSLTAAFVAQRALSALFWFVVTLVFATLAPGAVSRAISRFRLTTARILGIGAGAFIGTLIVVIAALRILPDWAGAVVGIMAFVLLMLSYGFGRVALQVSVGKFLQKRLLPQGKHTDSLAILMGVLFWTLVLSMPYVWTLAVFALFSAGVGLVLTARNNIGWKTTLHP